MSEKKRSSKKGESPVLPIEWVYQNGHLVKYANQMVVQFSDTECHLSFFEVRPPLLQGTEAEKQEQLREMRSIKADCVARIIVSPAKIADFAKALNGALIKVKEAMEQSRKESDDTE
jgi:hypothetical protein